MRLLSDAKVARRWASCGDAASRRRGGEGVSWLLDVFVGEEDDGEFAKNVVSKQNPQLEQGNLGCTHICRSCPRARR